MRFRSVYVAGHRGLVGSALVRNLQANGYRNILVRTHKELDLRNADNVRKFFSEVRPEAVVIAAAKVGGIHANSVFPVEFLLENLQNDITTPEHLLEIVRSGHFDRVGFCLDLGHAHLAAPEGNKGIDEAFELLAPRSFVAHAFDVCP